MRKRPLALALALAAAAAALPGCYSPCASCGWRFEVGRPATFNTPGLVQQNSGALGITPLGTTVPPMIGDVAAQVGPTRLVAPEIPHRMQMAPPAPDCTMQDICAMLRRIEARLNQPARPMPAAPEAQQE